MTVDYNSELSCYSNWSSHFTTVHRKAHTKEKKKGKKTDLFLASNSL